MKITLKQNIKGKIPFRVLSVLRYARNSFTAMFAIKRLRARLTLLNLRLSRRRKISDYLSTAPITKLQLGAGSNKLVGWLNSEGFVPSSFTHSLESARNFIFLDVCEPFPFDRNSIDYIFHEHLIEHLNYHSAEFMLQECFRILKPGGKVRIATPDLQTFVKLYGSQLDSEQSHFLREYIRFNSEIWSNDLTHVRGNHAVFVINHNFRAWGHQFIYDYPTLAAALKDVGFENVERYAPQVSKDLNLCGLEYRRDFVGIFDALVVEAAKPLECLRD